MKLCFATHNSHKTKEIQALLGNEFEILSLSDIGCNDEIPEEKMTLEENSFDKANFIWQKYQIPCFADDSGLEVEALNNAPGVFSARYAGIPPNDVNNLQLLLKNLGKNPNRKAQFRTCITLITSNLPDNFHQFEGIATGAIIEVPRGVQGFGYDPIFVPDGYQKTFAEMDLNEKNTISHRAKAFKLLIDFLAKNKF
jgi:XTP/dITP diphosphohydrolase